MNYRIDSISKSFWRNNEHFAALCNGAFFDGKAIIKPEDLSPYDNEETTVFQDFNANYQDARRTRDTVRKVGLNSCFAVIGIESQHDEDWLMPLRVLFYDTLNYTNQWQMDKKKKVFMPVFTIVFYTGEGEWQGPRSMKELLDVPKELEEYINDWKLIIIDINKEKAWKYDSNQEVYEVFDGVQKVYHYRQNREAMKDYVISKEAALMVGKITNMPELIEKAERLEEGGKLNMCREIEAYASERRLEGRQEGLLEGRQEAKMNVLKRQLHKKFPTVSHDWIEELEEEQKELIFDEILVVDTLEELKMKVW